MNFLIIILSVLIKQGLTEYCRDDITMFDVPHATLPSVLSMYTLGTVVSFTGCSANYKIDQEKVRLWLYNKKNYDTPIRIDRNYPSEIDPNQKIVFILHGWICNITAAGLPEMKNAYLQRYPNANIILVEWTTYSVDYYVNSYCRAPKIAEVLGEFICNLGSWFNIDAGDIHLVGHSMGAQISGLTGQETQRQCNRKIGRITGLDPAGPLYQLSPKSRRLDASDANVVDVIHTNQGLSGYYGTCGTVDYYPNCGYFQPGCQQIPMTTNMTEILNLPFKILNCSHQRSISYFTESILADNFKAASCTLCPGALFSTICVADFFFKSTSTMGEGHGMNPDIEGKYYLTTNSRAPFARS